MSEIKFASFDHTENAAVTRILHAWRGIFRKAGRHTKDIPDLLTMRMDLAAAHAEHPLKLDLLAAEAEDGTFDAVHDLMGIYRHMDRTTGKLGGCFVPRFAR